MKTKAARRKDSLVRPGGDDGHAFFTAWRRRRSGRRRVRRRSERERLWRGGMDARRLQHRRGAVRRLRGQLEARGRVAVASVAFHRAPWGRGEEDDRGGVQMGWTGPEEVGLA